MADEIISREGAKAQGLKWFFLEEPCPRGHRARRYVSTGQCTDCLRAWKRAWRSENRDRFNEKARQARAMDVEKARERTRRWQSTPAGKAVKARLQRERRARIRGLGGAHTVDDIAQILTAQRHCCAYCRSDIRDRFEVDHIVSLARGGSNARANLQMVCPSCNRRKRTKDPVDFARERGLLI